jgi:hypothetical protein
LAFTEWGKVVAQKRLSEWRWPHGLISKVRRGSGKGRSMHSGWVGSSYEPSYVLLGTSQHRREIHHLCPFIHFASEGGRIQAKAGG